MPLDSITDRRAAVTGAIQTDGLFAVEMLAVASSNLAAVGYDDDARRLYVRFRRGAAYRYDGVPNAVFEALLQADEDGDGSVGSTFHRLVKTAGFKFIRL
jgi:uncharacterized membrane-anchored protein